MIQPAVASMFVQAAPLIRTAPINAYLTASLAMRILNRSTA